MEATLLLASTIISTSTMTLFSYVISDTFRDLYKEPVLLKYVLSHFVITLRNRTKRILGWLIHYLIGLLFVLGYFIGLWLDYYSKSWMSGILYGAFIGLVGIVSWKIMFHLSGRAPIINPSVYYIQLFFAHLVFGMTTVAVYFLFELL